MPDNAKVAGLDRLKATMRAAERALSGPALTAPARDAEAAMVRAVRARTPRRTGALAASVRPAPAGRVTSGRAAAVMSAATYAGPREFGVGPRRGLRGGHNIRPARMFAQGAKDAGRPAIEAVAGAVQKTMRRVKGL